MAYPIYQLSGHSSKMRIPIAYRTEPGHIAYRLSPIAYRLWPIVYRLSPIAYRSPIVYGLDRYRLSIAYRLSSPIAYLYCLSPIAYRLTPNA